MRGPSGPNTRIVILGGGPAGLGAAHRLYKRGHENWLLCERNGYVGGLSASFQDAAGFTWDVGGHVLFSHYEYFDAAVRSAIGDAYYEHLRESWIRILETWVPYPFQNNIRHLPAGALKECLDGLIATRGTGQAPRNFLEWMTGMFGSGIVRYFMRPYNEKVWSVPLDSMSMDWIAERVSTVDVGRIQQNIAEQRDEVSWGPNNTFRFPRQGGTGAIFTGIARPFLKRIQLNRRVKQLDLGRKVVLFDDRGYEPYDVLVNTTPLDALIQCCTDAPDSVRDAARLLVHNSGLVVGLGISGMRTDSKCWMYFPEQDTPFYRVTQFHNYSPFNVPGGDTGQYCSFMCETSYSSHRAVEKQRLVDETVDGLVNAGLIRDKDRSKIVSRYVIDIPHSYPVPTIDRDRALSLIQPYLESRDVYSRGRFGAWKYEVGNMDHSFMQGVETVDRILAGERERTVNGMVA